ncbi:hypothetical protein BKA70DRAFT_48338 [Coprinopsis sp. MPI-PUGE-AT-0042]|nr:hypothetical protein BKA70DRAFT_48338 [Coprinopsis sp. MPI-PUGE-AT-0042]
MQSSTNSLVVHWSTETRRYILSCSQVSNTFRSYLLPRLFKDAPCYSSRCIQTLHDLLVANPRLATCIKSFSLVRGGKGSKWSRDVNWLAKDASLPLVVHLLSNSIEELTLETSIDCGHLAWACLRGHVKAALRTLVSSPSLKSLSIKYFQVSRDLIELISSSVEHLTLEGAQLANSSSNADLHLEGPPNFGHLHYGIARYLSICAALFPRAWIPTAPDCRGQGSRLVGRRP